MWQRLELYQLDSEPGPIPAAAVKGASCWSPEAAPVELGPGDLASFAADGPHGYETLRKGTRAVLVMEYT